MGNNVKRLLGASLLGLLALTSCGGGSESSSSRKTLDSVDGISYDFEQGTMSFATVEDATYYRIYFYYLSQPSEDYNNTTYFQTETVTITNPDGTTYESEEYKKDEEGNYLLKEESEILGQPCVYSKRYNAYYTNEEGEKTYYEAGQTMTITLPNDSIPGGNYLVGIKSGGPIALYSMSDWAISRSNLILHIPDPVFTQDYSVSWGTNGATSSTMSMGPMTMESSSATEEIILDGTGCMFEIENAPAMYAALSTVGIKFGVKDASGSPVSFSYLNPLYHSTDSSSFVGWGVGNRGEGVTEGTINLRNYVYAHQGPTMYYTQTGWLYLQGLTLGESYTLFGYAEGDGVSCYSSGEAEFEFEFQYSEPTGENGSVSGGGGGGGFTPPDGGGEAPAA